MAVFDIFSHLNPTIQVYAQHVAQVCTDESQLTLLGEKSDQGCCCRAKAGMSAAAEGKLASAGNNPFSGGSPAGPTPTPSTSQGAVDEGDIEAEGVESALISLERVTAVLTLNAQQGISPGMKVSCMALNATLHSVHILETSTEVLWTSHSAACAVPSVLIQYCRC